MANFAPYQDDPETQRSMSPLTSPRASLDRPTAQTATSPTNGGARAHPAAPMTVTNTASALAHP